MLYLGFYSDTNVLTSDSPPDSQCEFPKSESDAAREAICGDPKLFLQQVGEIEFLAGIYLLDAVGVQIIQLKIVTEKRKYPKDISLRRRISNKRHETRKVGTCNA